MRGTPNGGIHIYLIVMRRVGILSRKMRKTTIPMRRSQRPRVLQPWGHLPWVAVLFLIRSEIGRSLMLARFSVIHEHSVNIGS